MSTTTAARNLVSKGGAFLDASEHVSDDWFNAVDLDRLNISSGLQCILGQVLDGYSAAVDTLGINGASYGFDSGYTTVEGQETYVDADALNVAWTEYITDRRNGIQRVYVEVEVEKTVTREAVLAAVFQRIQRKVYSAGDKVSLDLDADGIMAVIRDLGVTVKN